MRTVCHESLSSFIVPQQNLLYTKYGEDLNFPYKAFKRANGQREWITNYYFIKTPGQ